MPSIALFKIFVHDLDEAIEFYVGRLGMEVREDNRLGEYRWVMVGYPDQPGFGVNLDLPTKDEERALVGGQAGGVPLFSIATDDCAREYETLIARGVEFETTPDRQPWGTSAILHDIAGNRITMNEDA